MSHSNQTNNQKAASPQLALGQLGGGALASGDIVNLFRGNLSFPLEILSLPGRNGLDCKVNLLYQSNVQYTVDKWNLNHPTSILGLGWSLPYEKIVISAKANGSNLDDDYYLINQGQTQKLIPIPSNWALGQLSNSTIQKLIQNKVDYEVQNEWKQFNRHISSQVRLEKQADDSYLLYDDGEENIYRLHLKDNHTYQVTTAGQSFELEYFQYWQIRYFQDYEKWEIVKDDGSIYTYGSKNLASDAHTLQYGIKWNNWVGSTTQADGTQYVSAWNLAQVTNIYGNYYNITYTVTNQTVGQGASTLVYTKECHVEQIKNDLEWSLLYHYLPKTYDTSSLESPKEYLDPHQNPNQLPTTPDAFQSQYSTQYLQKIELKNAKSTTLTYVQFDYYDLQNLTPKNENETRPMVQLAYGATYKRYLKAITQYYQENETKPGLQFTYNFTTDATQNRGALTEILYPAGGKGEIHYKEISVGADKQNDPGARNKTITNPFGEDKKDQPRIWYGDNYVVSAWYSDNASTLKINVFTWLGTWYQTATDWFNFDKAIDIDNLQIATSSNTFLLAVRYETSKESDVYLFHRNPLSNGHWDIKKDGNDYQSYSYGTTVLKISNGENFFIVNGEDTNNDKVIDRYAWNWSTQDWEVDHLADRNQLCQAFSTSASEYYSTAFDNYYIILCNDQTQDPFLNKFSIYYQTPAMNADGTLNWKLGSTFETSKVNIPVFNNFSYFNFSPSNSFAAVAYVTNYTASGSHFTRFDYELQILTWDDNFDNLTFATIEGVEESNFISIPSSILTALGPQAVDNTLVGAGPNTYYYDGVKWQYEGVGIHFNGTFRDPSTQYYWYAYTSSTILKTENTDSGVYTELTYRDLNNPGAGWQSIVLEDSSPRQSLRRIQAYPSLNTSYLTHGTKVYNRGVYNTWSDPNIPGQINEDYLLVDFSQLDELKGLTINTSTMINQAPYFVAFMTVDTNGDPTATYIAFLRNGDFIRGENDQPILEKFEGQQVTTLLDKQYHYQRSLNGKLPAIPLGFVTYSIEDTLGESTNIVLHRYANESTQNPIKAFVVDNVQVNTGYDTLSKCYDYADVTAAQDATGEIARFQTVTEYNGCQTPDDQKNGYTVSHFYNGLPPADSPNLVHLGCEEAEMSYTMLDGILLAKEQYDTSNTLISSTSSCWTVVTRIATDAQGTALRPLYGGIAQVYATTNMLDGVSTTTEILYSLASGNPTQTTSGYYGSMGEEISNQTLTTYAYEKYEAMWQQNLLKPVAQTKTQTKANPTANYTIQAIDVQTYQQWNGTQTPYWAPNAQYHATQADATPFTWWSSGTPGDDWLKISTIFTRNVQGGVIEAADADQVKTTMIYDDPEIFSIATFVNASANENGINYESFESYQTPTWNFSPASGGSIISTDSFTGTNSYNITTTGTLSQILTLTQLDRDYVFGGWLKTTAGVNDTKVTLELVDTVTQKQATKTVALTNGQWQYVQWVVNPSAVDITSTSLQLNINTTINSDNAYVRVDDLFWMPLDSVFTADVYDEDLLLHTASIAPNGVCKKTFYDLFYHPIGQTGVYENPLGFSTTFMTRQTTDMTDGTVFPIDTPNFGLDIGARAQGFYDQFRADALEQYTFIQSTASDWQVSDQQLQLKKAVTAPLGAQVQRKNFQADSLAVYITLDTNKNNTVSLGTGKIYVLWNGTKWQLVEDKGGTLTTLQEVTDVGFQQEWLLAVFDSRVMFFANGICLFNYQATELTQNNVVLGMRQPGSFNPILVAESISLGISYQDGTTKALQNIAMESGSSVILGATLYDNLGRGAIQVQPSRITTSDIDNPFAYYAGYITNGSSTDNIWDGVPITGPVIDYHSDANGYPFSRQVYESAPTQRPIQIGQPGRDFAITDQNNPHITTITYGNNEHNPGFFYPLPVGQYLVTNTTDPDGNTMSHYMDVFQKGQQDQAKQGGEETPPAYIGVIQTAASSKAEIRYSWIYDTKGQPTASLPPDYYESHLTTSDTSTLPAQASTYTYDFLGRQIVAHTPDTGTSKYIYDNLNQVRFYQDATGAAQGYLNYIQYDNLSRIVEKGYYDFDWNQQTQATLQNYASYDPTWPPATTTWSNKYTYDGDETTLNMIGNLWKSYANNQTSQDGDVSNLFAYDRLSNTTQRQNTVAPYSTTSYNIDYTYNVVGMPLTSTDSVTGLTVTLSYNPLRQVTSVQGMTQDQVVTQLASYTYTQEGDLEQAAFLPSATSALTTRDYTYMPPGWPKTITDGNIAEILQYTQGSCDQSGYYTGAIANQSVQYKKGQALTDDYCFTVDYLNRVANANNSTTSNTWTMDANSNFKTHVINEVTRTYNTTPNTNQLASITTGNNSSDRTYHYTEAGETDTIQDGNNTLMTLTYAKGNGLPQSISLPGNASNDRLDFTYGPDNKRVLKTASLAGNLVSQRLYIQGLSSNPTLEIDQTGDTKQIKRYIYLPGTTIIFYNNSYYVTLKDHLGSTRAIIDQSASIVGQYNYDVYGNPIITQVPDFKYDYLYTGQEYDTQTELYNYKARLYDPTIGRFLMTDPAGQYFSPYVYAGNNPVIFVDPSGQSSWAAFGAIVGGGAAIAGGVALTIATLGAATPVLVGSTILAGALIGAGTSSVIYGATHTSGNFSGRDFGIMVGLGAGFGAISGGIGLGIGSAGLSATASITADTVVGAGLGAVDGYVTNGALTGQWTGEQAGAAAGFGALFGGIVGGISGGARAFARVRARHTAARRIQRSRFVQNVRNRVRLRNALGNPNNRRQGNFGVGNNNIANRAANGQRILYRRNQLGVTSYIEYDDLGGPIKRVDLQGRSHNGVPTPHVLEYNPVMHQIPNPRAHHGLIYRTTVLQYGTPQGNPVRPAYWWEIP